MPAEKLLVSKIDKLAQLLKKFDEKDIQEFSIISNIVLEALKSGHTIFWCGNGGSASESSHLATEFIGRFKSDRRPLPSVALNADNVAITCIANDFGYDQIFSRQVEGFGKQGDVLITLSTSGESPNVINAIQAANKIGISTIALLGKGGGRAAKIAKHKIIVKSDETARIQEIHLLLGHSICEVVEIEFGID